MSWFSEKSQNAALKYCSIAGAGAGAIYGFSVGGLGGAILGGILGSLLGFFSGTLISSVFDKDAMMELTGCLLLIGIPVAIIIVIAALWNVGK
jgi:uncharacterized membrane protein